VLISTSTQDIVEMMKKINFFIKKRRRKKRDKELYRVGKNKGGLMGKYVNDVVEAVLDHVDLEQLISGYVPLKRAGTNVKGLCPFHNEKTPSFVVSSEKRIYHCFGCGASGNAIGFIMAIENLDFLDALEHLAEKVHMDLEPYLEKQDKQSIQKASQDKNQKKVYQEISKHSARFFYHQLKSSDMAMSYLLDRGISQETIKNFGLGYAPEGWQNLINYLAKPPYSVKDLEAVGLVINKENTSRYYDRFRDRIMFPIIDVQGKVIAFGGRIIGEGQPKYLNSPETMIFNKSNTLYNLNLAKNVLSEERTLIVMEGYMDVIALYQAGIKNVVATLGTALTSQHARLIKRYADKIIIAYDSDEAGQRATKRSVEILEKADLEVKVMLLTDGLDPDEYLKKYGVDVLKERLKKAYSYVDYQIHLFKEDNDLDYEEGRRHFYLQCVDLLKPLKESAIKNEYIKTVAKWSYMDVDTIKKDVHNGQQDNQQVAVQGQKRQKKHSKRFKLEVRLLYLALLNKQSFDKIFELIDFKAFEDARIKKILIFLKGYYHVMTAFDVEACIDHLSIDEIKFIQRVLEGSIKPENVDREIQVNCKNFDYEVLGGQIIRLSNQMMRLKEADNISQQDKDEQLKSYQRQLMALKSEQSKQLRALGR